MYGRLMAGILGLTVSFGVCLGQSSTTPMLPVMLPVIIPISTEASPTQTAPIASMSTVADTDPVYPTDEKREADPWISLDYLLWWLRPGASTPPQLTTGDPFVVNPGALTTPGTVVLLGNQGFNFGAASGLRLNAGRWLTREQIWAVEASAMVLEQASANFSAVADGTGPNPLALFTPVTEVGVPMGAIAQFTPISGPGIITTANLTSKSRLFGTDVNLVHNIVLANPWHASLLTGFRFQGLDNELHYDTLAVAAAIPGAFVSTSDAWKVQNRFYGWQVGGKWEYRSGNFFINNVAKLALGVTHQNTRTEGDALLNSPGLPPQRFIGGLYTNVSNLNREHHDTFSVVPEVQINAGCQLASWLRSSVGYNVLCWTNVLDPADMIDTRVNLVNQPAQVPVNLHAASTFWAHGLTFAIELQF